MAASKIIINCSTNFSSVRIEDPRKSPQNEHGNGINASQVSFGGSQSKDILQGQRSLVQGQRSKTESETEETINTMVKAIPELTKYFSLHEKIGEGTFSKVILGRSLKNKNKCYALKYVVPTMKPERIGQELRFLRDIGGSDNVCKIESAIAANGHCVIILPYLQHDKFTDYVAKLSMIEIQDYMKNLLLALARVHSFGVIHRDVKPSNFLFNLNLKKYLLVDFGLAQDEKDFAKLKKHCSYMARLREDKNKSLTQSQESNLGPNLNPNLAKPANQVLLSKPENVKNFMIRKRPMADLNLDYNLKNKKFKTLNGAPSFLHTPDTPGCPNQDNHQLLITPKTPSKNSPPPGGNVFKTPTKSNKQKKINNQIIIPETPQKTIVAPKRLLQDHCAPLPSLPISLSNAQSNKITISESATTPKSRLQDVSRLKCDCYHKAQICQFCDKKKEMYVPRAGTPGFRAPEVLLRTIDQSIALDIWSAGVIFASLLSRRYPFFRNSDDIASLAEIITFLGFKKVSLAATKLGKIITLGKKDVEKLSDPPNMKLLLTKLRWNTQNLSDKADKEEHIPDSAIDLLIKMLDPFPGTRISALDALKHDFICKPISLSDQDSSTDKDKIKILTPPKSQKSDISK